MDKIKQELSKYNRQQLGEMYNQWLTDNNRKDGNYSSTVFDFLYCVTNERDKLISELQERAEIAEDELYKLKQSDKITDEEIQVMADNYVSKELAHYMRRYQEAGRKDFIKGAKTIRDKLSVSEHSTDEDDAYEPYFGWCDVEGCENEGCRGGGVWPDTGYWTVCYKHSDAWRKGEPKPQMKQTAINREKSRKADRTLPPNTKLTSKT